MMRLTRLWGRLIACIVMGLVLLLGVLPLGQARAAQRAPAVNDTPYYLALGDSLSVGVSADGPPTDTTLTQHGYVQQIFNTYAHQVPGLQLMDIGCSGETSTSMINTTCPPGASYQPASMPQLTAAEQFLSTHNVVLVTIDIGANDINAPGVTPGNFQTTLNTLQSNLQNTILPGLRTAASSSPDPNVPIVGMNYYDTFLSAWANPNNFRVFELKRFCGPTAQPPAPPSSNGQQCAQNSVPFADQFNGVLGAAYGANNDRMANVAAEFQTDAPMVPLPPNGQPENVTLICDWTWLCQALNIHATATGYSEIANAFFPLATGPGLASSPQFGVANQTDLFDVGSNGAVEVRWVVRGGSWNGPMAISNPGLAPTGAHLAVSNQSGTPNQTDVFVVGNNGETQVLWVDGAGQWNGPLAIPPSDTAPPGAVLAASSQFGIPNQTDLVMIGNNGAAQVFWVDGTGQWNGPLTITPRAGAAPGSGIAISNQFGIPNQTDVFLVGNNGSTVVAWVDGARGWNGPLAITPPVTAPAGAQLATSIQFGIPNQTDVFVVANNGSTNVSWVEGAGDWNGPLSVTPVPAMDTTNFSANSAPPGAGIAASNQFGIPNQTDDFVVANAGNMNVSWVQGAAAWQGPLGISPAGNAPAGAGPSASNQFGLPNQTDVFLPDMNFADQVFWVEGARAWQGPLHI